MQSMPYEYRKIRLLGSGGTAKTYEAIDSQAHRVALKTLDPGVADNEAIVDAFAREARLCFDLAHPNIPACLACDLESGSPWIAFELVNGESLGDLIKENGSIDPYFAVKFTLDIARALSAIHKKGVLHRDVKPANVVVSPDGQVKLIDFGAAIRKDSGASASWAGTLPYCSPEQLKGEELDETSDLYSLGLVLYEMLTGRRLFTQESAPAIFLYQSRLPGELPLPSEARPGIPSEIDDLLCGLLAFRPGHRKFRNADELVDAIERIIDGNGWPREGKSS